VCPSVPYTLSFYAVGNLAGGCFLTATFNGGYNVPFESVLDTTYQQFVKMFPGTGAGVTQVTVAIMDSNCFGNLYIDQVTFAA
jgi:hypothetical protein